MKKIMVKDSSTVCPLNPSDIEGVEVGTKVRIEGKEFTVTYATKYQLACKGQQLHLVLEGASTKAPKEVSFEVIK